MKVRLGAMCGLLAVIAWTAVVAPARAQTETFDAVAPGGLPTGWSSTFTGASGRRWVVGSGVSRSAPNALVLAPIANNTTSEVTSPSYVVPAAGAMRLRFYRRHAIEQGWDGLSLLISVNGSPFVDVESGGGVFTAGGYNYPSDPPQPGYWSGTETAFVETVLETAPLSLGDEVRFRWAAFFDESRIDGDLQIDDVEVSQPPPAPPVIPTMGAWAVLLLGLGLAAAAGAQLSRRARIA